ncbi:hypothetical protein SCNRRL3882_6075 [Streptomyces chartreusis NRRL 3882]|uniref:Uncharacterized protein n=1 Tax=Streptomyces chartreusis NRRL 3882 TaxID=1079985 RepID=A0A2N9BGY2_STRCX|nr:hypothetical protein SCNRRL3882_6075 [Streptomyces chartreusis NRRL 3882]
MVPGGVTDGTGTRPRPGIGRVGLTFVRPQPVIPVVTTAAATTRTAVTTTAATGSAVPVVVAVVVPVAVVVVVVVIQGPTHRAPHTTFEIPCSVQRIVHEVLRGAHDLAQRMTERCTGIATGHGTYPFREFGRKPIHRPDAYRDREFALPRKEWRGQPTVLILTGGGERKQPFLRFRPIEGARFSGGNERPAHVGLTRGGTPPSRGFGAGVRLHFIANGTDSPKHLQVLFDYRLAGPAGGSSQHQ